MGVEHNFILVIFKEDQTVEFTISVDNLEVVEAAKLLRETINNLTTIYAKLQDDLLKQGLLSTKLGLPELNTEQVIHRVAIERLN